MNSYTDVAVRNGPAGGANQIVTSEVAVSGGNIYATAVLNNGVASAVSSLFVPTVESVLERFLPLTGAKSDVGVALTATATGGAMGVARTAGTSLQLVGEATSASAKTDKAMWEFDLPESYVAGSNIQVNVNAIVTGSGTLTAASTTIGVAAYTEAAGVETALTVTAAQQFDKTGEALSFFITGTGLVPGQHMALELTMLVTSASGANTGWINSASFIA